MATGKQRQQKRLTIKKNGWSLWKVYRIFIICRQMYGTLLIRNVFSRFHSRWETENGIENELHTHKHKQNVWVSGKTLLKEVRMLNCFHRYALYDLFSYCCHTEYFWTITSHFFLLFFIWFMPVNSHTFAPTSCMHIFGFFFGSDTYIR